MSRNTIIAIAAAVIAGGIVVAVSRRSRGDAGDGATGADDLKRLQKRKPHGGRKVRRADPYRDGHATPAGGDARPKTAPAYFKA